MRTSIVLAGAALGALAAAGAAGAAAKAANDVSISMKVAEIATAGPVAAIQVKNRGTASQAGVTVRIFANEDHTGAELWSGTVDLLPGKSATIQKQVWVDGPVEALCATATPAGAPDEKPGDNIARVGLVSKGKIGVSFAGREAYAAHCASCHGAHAGGGAGPSLVGAKAKALVAKAAAGGVHDFPWLGKGDGKALQTFLKNPSTVPDPAFPTPPAGGWPTYAGPVKALLDDRCITCHGPSLAERGVRLHTWEAASNWARKSLFAVKTGSMPQDGKRLTALETQLLEDWIYGGRRP